jgi:peptidoglycan/xylan/chitin deacetylase (PgdA/CDA1 family)
MGAYEQGIYDSDAVQEIGVGTVIRSTAKSASRFAAKSVFAASDVVTSGMSGPRILIYHQIGAGLGRQMEVSEQNFVRQIDWIQRAGDVVALESAIQERGTEGPRRSFVVTFDDGYRDVYERAWPVLRDRGLPFTLYLTTDPVESRIPLTPGGGAEPLEWRQVREMLDSGLMTLGAHTHTHTDLSTLDEPAVRSEVERSNELIAMRTGVEARHFTYPWGYWSAEADEVIREFYDTATLGSGPAVTSATDPYLINRMPVQLSDGMVFFKAKMTRGMRLEDIVRRRITGYTGP